MMNFVFKMMDFVLKMMDFVFKMMDFVLKMMDKPRSRGGPRLRRLRYGSFLA